MRLELPGWLNVAGDYGHHTNLKAGHVINMTMMYNHTSGWLTSHSIVKNLVYLAHGTMYSHSTHRCVRQSLESRAVILRWQRGTGTTGVCCIQQWYNDPRHTPRSSKAIHVHMYTQRKKILSRANKCYFHLYSKYGPTVNIILTPDL